MVRALRAATPPAPRPLRAGATAAVAATTGKERRGGSGTRHAVRSMRPSTPPEGPVAVAAMDTCTRLTVIARPVPRSRPPRGPVELLGVAGADLSPAGRRAGRR